MAKAKKKEVADREISIADAVSEVFGEFTELGEELRGWYDNMPEGPQSGDKGSEVDQAASDMEGIDEPDVPTDLQQIMLKFPPQSGRAPRSRADRRDAALYTLEQVLSELERALEGNMTIGGVVIPAGIKAEVEQLKTELDDAKDKAEAVDFPGR